MSSSKNLNNHQESFLSQTNSSFIENMYVRFIKKDPKLPESWSKYFEGLNDDVELVLKEIKGPSWGINSIKLKADTSEDTDDAKLQTIKAIALIRAYRIRGHLIANLDPLGMMERKYIHDLHPEDHGFKKKIIIKKYF